MKIPINGPHLSPTELNKHNKALDKVFNERTDAMPQTQREHKLKTYTDLMRFITSNPDNVSKCIVVLNSHDELVEALEESLRYITKYLEKEYVHNGEKELIQQIKKALLTAQKEG